MHGWANAHCTATYQIQSGVCGICVCVCTCLSVSIAHFSAAFLLKSFEISLSDFAVKTSTLLHANAESLLMVFLTFRRICVGAEAVNMWLQISKRINQKYGLSMGINRYNVLHDWNSKKSKHKRTMRGRRESKSNTFFNCKRNHTNSMLCKQKVAV